MNVLSMNGNMTKNTDLVTLTIDRLLKYAVLVLSIPIFIPGFILLDRAYVFLGMSFLVFSIVLILFSLSLYEKIRITVRKLTENKNSK